MSLQINTMNIHIETLNMIHARKVLYKNIPQNTKKPQKTKHVQRIYMKNTTSKTTTRKKK